MSEPRFEEPISDDLAEFAKAMASLQPLPSRVDRNRLMFEAGRASAFADNQALLASKQWHTGGAPHRWLWPTATAAMTGVAAVLAAMLLIARSSTPEVPAVAATKPAADSPESADAPLQAASAGERPAPYRDEQSTVSRVLPLGEHYLAVRQRALALGIDRSFAWSSGNQTESPAEPASFLKLRQRFLEDDELVEGAYPLVSGAES